MPTGILNMDYASQPVEGTWIPVRFVPEMGYPQNLHHSQMALNWAYTHTIKETQKVQW